jgi:uncharacterized membrane protein YdfJ with MMPL/SSD domain
MSASYAVFARGLLVSGPRLTAMVLAALPAAVVAMSTTGRAQHVSGLIAATWLVLVLIAVYRPWAAVALPVIAAGFIVLTVLALPFHSAPFIVDVWASMAMLVLSLPRRSPAT